MGGENQSIVTPDKSKSQSVINPDVPVVNIKANNWSKKKKKKKEQPIQTQALRQHFSNGECHWHDDANGLKFAMVIADWFVVKRELMNLKIVERTNYANNTIIRFHPYIKDGVADCVVTVEPLKFAPRFEQILNLK